MLRRIGPTLVCSAITRDTTFQRQLLDAQNIDRLTSRNSAKSSRLAEAA
jgi:hypothetical protein